MMDKSLPWQLTSWLAWCCKFYVEKDKSGELQLLTQKIEYHFSDKLTMLLCSRMGARSRDRSTMSLCAFIEKAGLRSRLRFVMLCTQSRQASMCAALAHMALSMRTGFNDPVPLPKRRDTEQDTTKRLIKL